MTDNIFSFDSLPPGVAYIDPSFLLNILIEEAKFHKQCVEYKNKLKTKHTVLFLSNLGLDEIWYVLLKLQTIKEHGSKGWQKYLNKHPETVKKYADLLSKITSVILEIPNLYLIEISAEQSLEALSFIKRYGLLPRDAIHLTATILSDIGNFITTDKAFNVITDINIYTCNL